MAPVVSKLETYNSGDLVLICDHYSVPEKVQNNGLISIIISTHQSFDEILAMAPDDIEEFKNVKFYEVMYNGETHFITSYDILGKIL